MNTDKEAWNEIFRYSNRNRGKNDIGYQAGEKICIKLNLTTCNARKNQVNPITYEKNSNLLNRIDNSPYIILALLRQLVNIAGVAQNDITIGDPTALVPNYYWNILYHEYGF
ncbi:hypothetical protein HY745_10520 [Candidatus Desantisbacteria bacterium]|nr:hypothetical protein [Candidatus Desantisbacteria bacterium]